MFRGLTADRESGEAVMVLGLFDDNAQALRQNNPILFRLDEIYPHLAPTDYCVITWVDPELERFAAPEQTEEIKIRLLITVHEHALAALEAQPGAIAELTQDEFTIALFRCKDDQEASRMLEGSIGPQTRVTRSGYAPSDPNLFEGN